MNIELAKKVYKQITSHRDLFDMDVWIEFVPVEDSFDDRSESSCGTTACIAGWAVILCGKYTLETSLKPGFVDRAATKTISRIAMEELELTFKQMDSLFYERCEDAAIAKLEKAIELAQKNELEDDYILLDDEKEFMDLLGSGAWE